MSNDKTTVLKRHLSNHEIQVFFQKHQPNCPYCGAPMTPLCMDDNDLLRQDGHGLLHEWILTYTCACTSKEQAYG